MARAGVAQAGPLSAATQTGTAKVGGTASARRRTASPCTLATGRSPSSTSRSMLSPQRRARTDNAPASGACRVNRAMPTGSTGSAGKVPPAACRAASSSAGWNGPADGPHTGSSAARVSSPGAMRAMPWKAGPISMPSAARWATQPARPSHWAGAAGDRSSGAAGAAMLALACSVHVASERLLTETPPSGRASATSRTGASSSTTGSAKAMPASAAPGEARASISASSTAPGTTTRPCTRWSRSQGRRAGSSRHSSWRSADGLSSSRPGNSGAGSWATARRGKRRRWKTSGGPGSGAPGGAACSTTCALVPENPNEETPAQPSGIGVSAADTARGVPVRSICGFSRRKCSTPGTA